MERYMKIEDVKIDDMYLSNRLNNALKNEKLFTIGDILNCKEQFLKLPNIGSSSVHELNRELTNYGVCLDLSFRARKFFIKTEENNND